MSDLPRPKTTTVRRWGLICLFLLAFLPRAIYPVSRPLQWYFRSSEFFSAVLRADWTATLFSEHPGVTVMWLSGGALWGWQAVRALLGLPSPTPLQIEGYAFANRIAVGVLPLALVVTLGIIWGWHLLRRLFGERVAWPAALLWAVDPFFLANSKVLHLDATLSTLMLLSALYMLVYLKERAHRPLILSAFLSGLAILTKVTAIFLVPFFALCLLVGWLSSFRRPESRWRTLANAVGYLLLWLLIAGVTCVLLWPSLWAQPGKSIDLVFQQGILLHTGSPRDQPLFYRGTLAVQDPGPRFYTDVLLYRSTFLTLPFALVGLVTLGATRWWSRGGGRIQNASLLVAFAVFYFLQMSLGGWKDSRYMLPILLVLDVFAAQGIAYSCDRLFSGGSAQIALVGGLIGLQAVMVLPRHPYYGAHYNALLGGARRASQVFALAEFGEGLDRAGRYVDEGLEPGAGRVATQFLANEMVAQHVRAPVYDVSQVGDEAEYLVFGVHYTMRGRNYPRWGELWEESYKFREPAFVANVGGLPYAWVHLPHGDPRLPQEVDAQLGTSIRLLGYRLAPSEPVPGDTQLLTLYWKADARVNKGYKVFTHLVSAEGELKAQHDSPPGRGNQPTDAWVPGVLVEDAHELSIPSDASSGRYVIRVGMYEPATMERLAAWDSEGNRAGGDSLVLTAVRVHPLVPAWRWALSGCWLAAIAAGIVYPALVTKTRRSQVQNRP